MSCLLTTVAENVFAAFRRLSTHPANIGRLGGQSHPRIDAWWAQEGKHGSFDFDNKPHSGKHREGPQCRKNTSLHWRCCFGWLKSVLLCVDRLLSFAVACTACLHTGFSCALGLFLRMRNYTCCTFSLVDQFVPKVLCIGRLYPPSGRHARGRPGPLAKICRRTPSRNERQELSGARWPQPYAFLVRRRWRLGLQGHSLQYRLGSAGRCAVGTRNLSLPCWVLSA